MSATEHAQVLEYELAHYDVNGIATAVFRAGNGTPVVILHGAGRVSTHTWALGLADRHEVVRPVHPGFGESDDDPSVDSVHDYVLHYLDLFDQLGLDRFHLVGHSLGGYIAASFAVEHSPRLRSLALVAPPGLQVPEAPTVDIFSIPPDEVLSYLTEDAGLLSQIRAIPPGVDALVQAYRESSSLAQIFWQRSYDLKLARWLHRVSVPTLVLWGSEDRLIPAAQAQAWTGLLPNSSAVILDGYGHLVLDECPRSAEVIGRFIDDCETAPGP